MTVHLTLSPGVPVVVEPVAGERPPVVSEATRPSLERLAALRPRTLACMHGAAWRGDGQDLLLALADALTPALVEGRVS